MGNTDKSESKKFRRKIKIRLVDPDIPDSYVCEIFESAIENEEDISKNKPVSEDKEGTLKPKNYFELLMSKKYQKNHTINMPIENEVFRNYKKSFAKKKQVNQKNKNILTQTINGKKEERKYDTESSEDENLLQMQQSKCKLEILDSKKESSCFVYSLEEKVNEAEIRSEDVFTSFDSQKIELCQKKTLNILNYFSKTEGSSNSSAHNEKLEEISVIRNSLKTCQTAKSLKPSKKQSLDKTCQNDKKNSLNGINKENVKLAPLFCKRGNKIIDPARQKARLDFLYKGSSSVVKKSENKTSEKVLHFPTVLHVQQKNDSVFWSRRKINLPLPELHHPEDSPINGTKKFKLQIKDFNINNQVLNYSYKISKDFLDEAKCKYLGLNLNVVIDGLKEKRDRYLARAEEIVKSETANCREDSSSEIGFEEPNALWIEKYKPKSNEILGNGYVVKKLKKWLVSWKSFDEELKILAKSSRGLKNQMDSDDDFLHSRSDNFGLKTPCNVCIISGPNGCGKTALVYALANELDFGVLELNASSKRTGKKVLSDLQEATQSHKVHRVNPIQADVVQKEVKKKKNKRRKKIKKAEDHVKNLDHVNDCRISLILIEDADIVFDEHDEGFFSAIATLVQTSKRPLIFLTNQPNSHYLYNLKTEQCLVLEMELPNFYKSCAILDVISSLEGTFFDKEILEFLVQQNQFDLRKSLLQLQFWIPSSENTVVLRKQFDLGLLWWGLSKFLFKKDIKHYEKPKNRKRKRTSDLFDSTDDELETAAKKLKSDLNCSKNPSISNINAVRRIQSDPAIESYFKVLDLASVLDCFCLPGSKEPVPGFECKPKDSLSLDENMEEVFWVEKNLSEQLSDELITLSELIFSKQFETENESRKLSFVSPCWEEIRWRNSQEKASEELSSLVSLQRGRDNRSLHLDYLPVLRNICRVEKDRSEMNPKRKNRFYHYLNNLGVELNDENLEINCEVFDR